MRLLLTETSPYGRVSRICVRALGLEEHVEEVFVALRTPGNETLQFNPTGKVPTLVLDDGRVLSELAIVCTWLCGYAGDRKFMPPHSNLAQQELTGVVTGFVDGVSVWIREMRRRQSERSPDIIRQERERVARCIPWFDAKLADLDLDTTYTNALLVTALGKLPALGVSLEKNAPALARWAQALESRPAFTDTRAD